MRMQNIQKITLGGILAAATVLLTTAVSVPIPGGLGYINLGDAGVLLSAALLGSPWGILCSGIASAISDLLLGYAVYAPATFLIKSITAAVLLFLHRRMYGRLAGVAFFLASLCVPLGYLAYESLLYGFSAAIPNLSFNLLQGCVGAVCAMLLCRVIGKFHPVFEQEKSKQ